MALLPDPDKLPDFVLEPPGLTVLTDQALDPAEAHRDRFNLDYRMGPVYDIVRHPATRTPLAIAVYGHWGTGKTTAMTWLEGLLETWNAKGKADDKITVKPVWFYPWKYHTKEDVWRGLVAEVILASIDVRNADLARVTKAAKLFGLFLGRSFMHVLAGIKLKVKDPTGTAEAEVSFASIREVFAEYREAAHPEQAYLNDFEASLKSWVNDTLGENQRMVIFIDDLDRCLPDIALQVLEALKLYLNIPRLIFVVGVDRTVIDKLVQEHYIKLGLDPDKSKHYLAKMFQVEVELAPTEGQIEAFLDENLGRLSHWNEHLSDDEQDIFRDVILELADRNPREVKRLLNNALLAGAGNLMTSKGSPR